MIDPAKGTFDNPSFRKHFKHWFNTREYINTNIIKIPAYIFNKCTSISLVSAKFWIAEYLSYAITAGLIPAFVSYKTAFISSRFECSAKYRYLLLLNIGAIRFHCLSVKSVLYHTLSTSCDII